MRLVRYGRVGHEKPGVLDSEGRIRDLSKIIPAIDPPMLAPRGLAKLRAIEPRTLPLVKGTPRLGVPFTGIGKIVAVGLNYSDHATEAGMPIPQEPILFFKATTCISGPDDEVVVPKDSVKTDYECELGVVIGTQCRHVPEESALDHVAGYCIVNDVSEREYQLERNGTQWDKGKGCDTFGPIGPWLVTPDEIPDPQALSMFLDVNGERRQSGTTATMIFGVRFLVSYISRFMTLLPGDLIATGTPPGVGLGFKPPRFLRPGDEMHLGIQGLGDQRQRLVAFPGTNA